MRGTLPVPLLPSCLDVASFETAEGPIQVFFILPLVSRCASKLRNTSRAFRPLHVAALSEKPYGHPNIGGSMSSKRGTSIGFEPEKRATGNFHTEFPSLKQQ